MAAPPLPNVGSRSPGAAREGVGARTAVSTIAERMRVSKRQAKIRGQRMRPSVQRASWMACPANYGAQRADVKEFRSLTPGPGPSPATLRKRPDLPRRGIRGASRGVLRGGLGRTPRVRHQRLARELDRAHLGFGLPHDLGRKCRIAEKGGVRLPVVDRPPQKADEGCTTRTVVDLAPHENVAERGDGIGVRA